MTADETCPICGQSFPSKKDLKRHVRIAHNAILRWIFLIEGVIPLEYIRLFLLYSSPFKEELSASYTVSKDLFLLRNGISIKADYINTISKYWFRDLLYKLVYATNVEEVEYTSTSGMTSFSWVKMYKEYGRLKGRFTENSLRILVLDVGVKPPLIKIEPKGKKIKYLDQITKNSNFLSKKGMKG